MLCSITSYHVTGVIFYDVASTVHWTLPLGSLTAWAAGTFEAGVDSGRHAEMSPFAALARCSAPHVYSDLPAASSPSSPLLSPPPAPPVSQLAARLTACVRDHIHEVTDLGGDIGVGAPMAGGSLSTSTRPTLNLLFFLLRFLHLLLLLLLLLLSVGVLRTSTRPTFNLLLLIRASVRAFKLKVSHAPISGECLVSMTLLHDQPRGA